MKCILSSHSSLCKLQIADEKKINAKIFTTPSFSVVSRQTGEAEDGVCLGGGGCCCSSSGSPALHSP